MKVKTKDSRGVTLSLSFREAKDIRRALAGGISDSDWTPEQRKRMDILWRKFQSVVGLLD